MSELRRIPSLDGLRAISIALVFLGHASLTVNFPSFLLPFSEYSLFGVRVFFVISGFLITLLLVKEREKTGKIALSQFYIRRAYRIFPAAFLVVAILSIAYWHTTSRLVIFGAFFYFMDFVHSTDGRVLGHMWSLAVEEQFYLLWPALFLFGYKYRSQILFFAVIAAPLFRFYAASHGHEFAVIKAFPCVQDALATGCLLAIHRERIEKFARWIDWTILPIAIATLTLATLHYPKYVEELLITTLINFGIALCVDHCVRHRYWLLNCRPVVWVGVMSYSLYLCQQPFFDPVSQTWMTQFPINLALAVIAAVACHYLVEVPFLNLRDHRKTMKLRLAEEKNQSVA
jgi:peptidoglycan/LPS O-acetylase OafA/YrhL